MSARTDLAAAIRAAAPKSWTVHGFAVPPDNIAASTPALVLIDSGDWTPATDGQQASLRIAHDVWIATPIQDPEKGEDALEDIALELGRILDGLSNCDWTRARRGVLAPGFPARIFETTSYTEQE